MTLSLIPLPLSTEQQGQVLGILSVGCDRETAAAFIGRLPADIARAMRSDLSFCNEVRRTEAGIELSHMRNVREAAKDPKNWRTSVWWLERRSPERYGARTPGAVTTRQLKMFMQILAENLNNDVRDPLDRQRVLNRLTQIGAYVDHLADDLLYAESEPVADTIDDAEAATDGESTFASDEFNE